MNKYVADYLIVTYTHTSDLLNEAAGWPKSYMIKAFL